ncbi:MAG: hypothetical protein ACXIUM_04805 [Wenzhouxiangella sp.]
MKDKTELSPLDLLSADTFRMADEMCANLSTQLSLDKRGQAVFFNGAFTDLRSVGRRQIRVTVADLGGQPWLTLIADREIPATQEGLLVFKVPPSDDRRYVGKVRLSRPGRRVGDDPEQYFAVFDIERDARRS